MPLYTDKKVNINTELSTRLKLKAYLSAMKRMNKYFDFLNRDKKTKQETNHLVYFTVQ